MVHFLTAFTMMGFFLNLSSLLENAKKKKINSQFLIIIVIVLN